MSTPARVYFGGKAPKPMEWTPLPYMQEYLDELAGGEEPRAVDYIRSVKKGLNHFARFAISQGITHPEQLERRHIIGFQTHLSTLKRENGELLSLSYRQQLMKYVRTWINWLEAVRYIEKNSNPWYRIRVGRQAKKPKPLEMDEVVALFDAHRRSAFQMPPFFYHRRETILILLFGWGLRIHELQLINVDHVDLRLEVVGVRNKGGGIKPEPYSDVMKDVIKRWLSVRPKYARIDEDALLIDQSGTRLSIQMLRKIIVECGLKGGVTLNPHRLRDTMGTVMLDNDAPVERLMKIYGHTQRSQTLAYARIGDPKVKETHDKIMNPILSELINPAIKKPPVR